MVPQTWRRLSAVGVVAGSAILLCAATEPVPEIAPGYLMGYLPKGGTPSSLVVLPPAPTADSATQGRDNAEAKVSRSFKGSPRWTLATSDANLKFPAAAGDYACAVGVNIDEKTTPRTYVMLRRVLTDAGLSTYPTKTKYKRPRPFMVSGGEICTPEDEKGLRSDGSYPSGHSAIGWAWALVLAEAAPDRQDQILARGRAFLQSRLVCNVHWLSDTEAGAMMGAAVVARLHDEAAFRDDLAAARDEITAARAAGSKPTRDCAAEAAAMASDPIDQP
jgi:acid phosphatase (class A)